MKSLISFLSFFLFTALMTFTVSTHAQMNLSERVSRVASKIKANENSMDPADYQQLRQLTSRMEAILNNYTGLPDDNMSFICLSNGATGTFERFSVYNPATGSLIGGETSKANCEQAIRSARHSLVCVSNGAHGTFEKFLPFDSSLNSELGGETILNNCLQVVTRSTLQFVCLSNGNSASFEKFILYDRRNDKYLGGETSLPNCLSSIGNRPSPFVSKLRKK